MKSALFAAVLCLLALVFLAAWFLFRKAFFHPKARDLSDEATLMHSAWFSYASLLKPALQWFSAQNWRELKTIAVDGAELRGLWLPKKGSSTTLLLFHDYCGGPQDLSLLARWGYRKGFGVLAVHQRAHGSGGDYSSLGILEASDCRCWAETLHDMLQGEQNLILYGSGMGGSAVFLALDQQLPETVQAVICDSPIPDIRALLKRLIRNQLRMQVFPLLQILCLYGKKLWGKNPDAALLSETAAKGYHMPVFFSLGKLDHIFPWGDTKRIADSYTGEKYIFLSENAGHGAAILADYDGYCEELSVFLDRVIRKKEDAGFEKKA